MTTYADLLAGAAEQIRVGAGQLRTDTFWSADEALDVIGDFHAVLDAVASHTRRLLWPAQIQRIGLTSHRDGLSPNERAAIALAAGIEALVGAARPHPSQFARVTTPWLRAAVHLRAASDLVATHFHPDGRPRTPDASATDTRALDAGLVDLGHLAATILSAEEPLALRALQADVTKAAIAKHLPGLGHLADLARDLSTADGGVDASARARLEALPQTWTPIRTEDPVTELGDRMHRLRQATFDMAAGPGDTLATLRDITTIGSPSTPTPPPSTAPSPQQRWIQVLAHAALGRSSCGAEPGSGCTASSPTSSPSPRHTRRSATTSSPSAACCPPSHRSRPARAAQHSRTLLPGASAQASTVPSRP